MRMQGGRIALAAAGVRAVILRFLAKVSRINQ